MLTELQDLLFGGPEGLALYLGVTAKTIGRWRASNRVPIAIERLLRIRAGDLAAVFGPDWAGVTIEGGRIHVPHFARGFTPHQLQALFFTQQEMWYWRSLARRRASEIARLRAEIWAREKVRSVSEAHPVSLSPASLPAPQRRAGPAGTP